MSKTENGAALSWSPPANSDIIEYSVYLAMKVVTQGKSSNFIRVYLGHEASCVVSHNQLAQDGFKFQPLIMLLNRQVEGVNHKHVFLHKVYIILFFMLLY